MATPSVPTRAFVLANVDEDGVLDAGVLRERASELEISAEGVRLCLRRLVTDGTLEPLSGRGRTARYRAASGIDDRLVPELRLLDFALRQDAGLEPWDGQWHLVAFAIPERRRRVRDELRRRLRFLGGAGLDGGLYVSANGWEPLVEEAASELGARAQLTLATASSLEVGGLREPAELAAGLWPLDDQRSRWRTFVGAAAKRRDRARAEPARAPAEAIATVFEFTKTIEPDPLLPPELLPPDWPGPEGRRAFFDDLAELARLAGSAMPGAIGELARSSPARRAS